MDAELISEALTVIFEIFAAVPGLLAIVSAIVSAILAAYGTHFFTERRDEDRRERNREKLRSTLVIELRSNTKRLWNIFLASEYLEIQYSNVSDAIQVNAEDSAEEKARKNKQRKRLRIYIWAAENDRGLYYSNFEAIQDQLGSLEQSEIEAVQEGYRDLRVLEGFLNTLPQSNQLAGQGDNILTTPHLDLEGDIRSQAPRALKSHLEAIAALEGGLNSIEEGLLQIVEADSPSQSEIERLDRQIRSTGATRAEEDAENNTTETESEREDIENQPDKELDTDM